MLLRYILWAFLLYGLFRLIFDVIIPIVRVSGQMKKKMREFQENVHQQYKQGKEPDQKPDAVKQRTGDYIDFEELKSK